MNVISETVVEEIVKQLIEEVQDVEGYYLRRYYPLDFTLDQILQIEEHTWEKKPTISTIRKFMYK